MAKIFKLTDDERSKATVTFNVNKFELHADGILLGAYSSKRTLQDELYANKLFQAKFDKLAREKYWEDYGN